jgi:uncharacterized protein YqeY
MMSILETIEQEMRSALKEGNEVKKTTLRMVKADLLNEKAKTGKDLTDDQSLEVISRCAKKRKEAIEEFAKAGREDLASREREELVVIEHYLPKQLSEAEITAAIDAKLAVLGSVTQKEMGKVMGEIMKDLKGRADGNIVRKILSSKLEGK